MRKIINQFLGEFDLKLSRVSKSQQGDSFLEQQRLLKMAGRTCATIFDVGANYGQTYARYRKIFPMSSIHSFEPFPDSYEKLKERILADGNAVANKIAISDTSGEESFFVNYADATNSLFERNKKGKRYYPAYATTKEEIKIRATTLDEYVQERSICEIDILKMDIQGGELKALNGARNLLRNESIFLIFSEVMYIPHYERSPMMHELWAFLSGFQYSLYNIYNNIVAGDGQLCQGDAIFVSPSLRKQLEALC